MISTSTTSGRKFVLTLMQKATPWFFQTKALLFYQFNNLSAQRFFRAGFFSALAGALSFSLLPPLGK